MSKDEKPIAVCLLNAVEAFEFPFYLKKGIGVEPDQLLLEVHLWHMTDEEKAVMGETLEINSTEDLEDAGFTTDDRGVYIIGEDDNWMEKPDFPTMQ